jgi:4'-phosphopantetheinyl transferase
VWSASTDERAPRADELAALTPEERQRAASFRFDKDRAQYVLGKRMLRSVLARALELDQVDVRFEPGPFGKPALAGPAAGTDITFNLSHSGRWVLCALARGRRVGVDVEREREGMEYVGLAERFFCPREIGLLTTGPDPETRRLFFKYWTLKEAYLKAEGSGLSISLTAMDASQVPDDLLAEPVAPYEDRPRGILVQRLPAAPGYAAAVAGDGPPWTTELRPWVAEDFGMR